MNEKKNVFDLLSIGPCPMLRPRYERRSKRKREKLRLSSERREDEKKEAERDSKKEQASGG